MVRWHHQLNGHEFEQTLGDSEGQGSLVCHSPWGHKESDTTEQLNNNRISILWGPHPREKGAQISEQLWKGQGWCGQHLRLPSTLVPHLKFQCFSLMTTKTTKITYVQLYIIYMYVYIYDLNIKCILVFILKKYMYVIFPLASEKTSSSYLILAKTTETASQDEKTSRITGS